MIDSSSEANSSLGVEDERRFETPGVDKQERFSKTNWPGHVADKRIAIV